MKSNPKSTYAVLVNGKVHQIFAGTQMAEWNENQLTVVDVTAVSPSPDVGWVANGNSAAWFFTPPSVPKPTTSQLVSMLAARLAMAETAGVFFTPSGSPTSILFPSDNQALVRYTAIWNSITEKLWVANTPIIASDGTPVAMTAADAKSMITKVFGYITACANQYASLHTDLLANSNTNLSAGWPPNT